MKEQFSQHLTRAEALVGGTVRLRFFRPSDAYNVAALAGDPRVAQTTAHIPQPYALADAQHWIGQHLAHREACTGLHWAILEGTSQLLVGALSFDINGRNRTAYVGYWVGQPYWGRGFASSAVGAGLDWALGCGLEKLAAQVLTTNAASIKVLQRCGFEHEGTLKSHARRQGERQDILCFGQPLRPRGAWHA